MTRRYDFRPDLNDAYLKSVAGWIGGLMARVGIEERLGNPASLEEALKLLNTAHVSLQDKAKARWDVLSKLARGGDE